MAEHVDMLVVGRAPAAVASAILAARRGQRTVLLLPAEDAAGETAPAPSAAAPPASLWDAPDALGGETRPLRRALAALGAETTRTTRTLQLLAPRLRLDVAVGSGAEACLVRAQPRAGAAVAAFVARLTALHQDLEALLSAGPCFPAEGLWPRLWQARVPTPLRALTRPFDAAAQAQLLAGLPADGPLPCGLVQLAHAPGTSRPPSVALAVYRLWQALFAPPLQWRGHATTQAALQALAERAGVDVRPVHAVTLRLHGRRATGVHLHERAGTTTRALGASRIVADVDRPGFAAAAPAQAPAGAATALVPSWRLQLRRGWLPQPLAARALGYGEGAAAALRLVRADAPAGAALPGNDDGGDGDAGAELLEITDLAGAPDAASAKGLQAAAAPRPPYAQLAGLMPHLAEATREAHYVLAAAMTQPVHPRGACAYGLAGRRRRSRLGNVVHCGTDVLGSLGLLGALLTAQGVVAALPGKPQPTGP